jgi:hypothetical protein
MLEMSASGNYKYTHCRRHSKWAISIVVDIVNGQLALS